MNQIINALLKAARSLMWANAFAKAKPHKRAARVFAFRKVGKTINKIFK